MSYQLFYGNFAEFDSKVPKSTFFSFKKHSEMVDFIDEKCIGRNGSCVWLCYKYGTKDIFVSDNHLSIQDFFEKKALWQTVGDYWLKECKSFNDAYKIALEIINDLDLK